MYHKAYGIIETLAPLYVGASAGEDRGNLNLIFRDQFTQTGIVPGSSVRGRFRADMRNNFDNDMTNLWYGRSADTKEIEDSDEGEASGFSTTSESQSSIENTETKETTSEALVKFEYASLLWIPVFCPGQPVVWVTSPRLLNRYRRIAGIEQRPPVPEKGSGKYPVYLEPQQDYLFFNLGFLNNLEQRNDLVNWVPAELDTATEKPNQLVVVDDNDIGTIHDMALYRQTRTRLEDDTKKVKGGAFFGFEAIPEASILVFPIAIKKKLPAKYLQDNARWQPMGANTFSNEMYFGGLESIGCGRCNVTLAGDYFRSAEAA